ncbi:hypothetical protein LINPERHAP1_LOCUS9003 [Linum perenne]
MVAFRVVLYNSSGQILDGKAGTFYCNSPIVLEAKALLEATLLAAAHKVTSTIYSDCLKMVTTINRPKHRWLWECFDYLGRISELLALHPYNSIKFINDLVILKETGWPVQPIVVYSTGIGFHPCNGFRLLFPKLNENHSFSKKKIYICGKYYSLIPQVHS